MNPKKNAVAHRSFDLKNLSKTYHRQSMGDDNSISLVSREIKTIFRSRRLKCTPQRLAVLGIMQKSMKHLSITEVHKDVKRILPRTGLATIYRTLETLEKLGLVVRVHLEDGCQSYALAPSGHQHPIVCVSCNRVVDFEECPIEDISRRLSRETGFKIQQHFLQLFGRCRECQVL
jgi:Fur family ferric uptake transcriptional regulator